MTTCNMTRDEPSDRNVPCHVLDAAQRRRQIATAAVVSRLEWPKAMRTPYGKSISTCFSKSATMLASRVIQSRWKFFLLPNLPAERRSGTGVRPQATREELPLEQPSIFYVSPSGARKKGGVCSSGGSIPDVDPIFCRFHFR